jgi:hypothetical protein
VKWEVFVLELYVVIGLLYQAKVVNAVLLFYVPITTPTMDMGAIARQSIVVSSACQT